MKRKLTRLVFFCMAIICNFTSFAQNAEVLFINNNSGQDAATLDIEVRVMPIDTVYVKVNGISYLHASTPISVPSSTILKISFLKSGTLNSYYTYNNAVLNSNEFACLFLFGTSASKRFSKFTAYHQSSSSGKVKFDFRHSTPDLGEIDLVVRQTSVVLADNFEYTDGTFSFNNEINASDYILDIFPSNNNTIGLFAYNFPGASLGHNYVVLFTAGTSNANDMYMVKTNGTVTKLTTSIPYQGIDEHSYFKSMMIFPNPANNRITIEFPLFVNNKNCSLSILNSHGQLIAQQSIQNPKTEIEISEFLSGLYILKFESTNGIVTRRFIKE